MEATSRIDACGNTRSAKVSGCGDGAKIGAVKIAADLSDEDNPEIFSLEGNWLDLSDLLETCFILSTGAKFLCREDCPGLCPICGKNLGGGPCGCKKEIDPRLAVLGQLLDKNN